MMHFLTSKKSITFIILSLLAVPRLLAGEAQETMNVSDMTPAGYAQDLRDLIALHEAKLGIYKDPFRFVFSTSEADAVYERMLKRPGGFGQWRQSTLSMINQFLMKVSTAEAGFDPTFVQLVVQDAHQSLMARLDRPDLQANLIALQEALKYVTRFLPVGETTSDEKKDQQQTKSEQTQSEQKQPEQQDQPEPDPAELAPEYPEMSDTYKPHTKDVGQENGDGDSKNKKKTRVIEVNFETSLLGGVTYQDIRRGAPLQTADSALLANGIKMIHHGSKQMVVHTLGKTSVKLFLPPGHVPTQPADTRATISQRSNGAYVLTLQEVMNDVMVPLEEAEQGSLPKQLYELYTRPVGFDNNDWPESVQVAILRKFDPHAVEPKVIAQAIQQHLSKDYLYSIGARPETDPVDALNAGAFQCDMAAYTMASVLRDAYHIPTRVVAGYRAQKYNKERDKKSYLVLPSDAHAWVEVFYDDAWHAFDPTPVKKDKDEKDDKKGKNQKNEYSDRSDSDEKEEQKDEAEKTHEPQGDQSLQSEQTSSEEMREKVETGSKAALDDLKKQQEQENDKKPAHGSDKNPDAEPYLQAELDGKLANFNFNDISIVNPLKRALLRLLLIDALNPLNETLENANKLSMMQQMFKVMGGTWQDEFTQGIKLFESKKPGIIKRLSALRAGLFEDEVNLSFRQIVHMVAIVHLYISIIDRPEIKSTLRDIERELTQALDLMNQLKDDHAADIALVEYLKTTLPAIAWNMVREQYGIKKIGPDAQTVQLAHDIRSGKLNDMLLMAYLTPMTDFILNHAYRPEYLQVKSWLREAKRGKDILPVVRISELSRAILGKPQLSLEENYRQGTAFIPTKRKIVQVPADKGIDEADRITIVGFDTSGSMSGEPAEFQAGLIAAFVGRALSDVSTSGRQRHRVVVVPFDDEVGTPRRVSTTQEAYDLFHDYQQKLGNTSGGTDIQKFLMQAMALIAKAQEEVDNPLDAANIVLMTDGQSPIDYTELKKAREAISRDTPLQMMFVAINDSNPELMKFAQDSKAMGAEHGFYRQFSGDVIHKILQAAKTIDTKRYAQKFYTSQSPKLIPAKTREHLDAAIQYAYHFSDEMKARFDARSMFEHLADLERTKWPQDTFKTRELEQWIADLRLWLDGYAAFKNKDLVTWLLDDLIRNFEQYTKIALADCAQYEVEQIKHLFKDAIKRG